MVSLFQFLNFDLVAVGIMTAIILILGFVILFTDPKSVTHRTFFFFVLLTFAYAFTNSLHGRAASPENALWILRFTVFFAVWHAFSMFQLFYVFPSRQALFSRSYLFGLVPLTAAVSFLTLTPFVFSRIVRLGLDGQILEVENGPGIASFGAMVLGLVLAGVYLLIKKTLASTGIARSQFKFLLTGTLTTFALILVFNFILPNVFGVTRFISFVPIFVFPFVLGTTYAIMRHGLLNAKVISTEILVFLLSVTTFVEVLFSQDLWVLLFRLGAFVMALAFGILLIRSVLREVKQREELERLAKDLQSANDKLEELSRFKSQLLSLASHQIKSPLAAIKGFASILLDGLYGPLTPKVAETLKKMKRSSDDLLGLINTLLDLRRVDEGKMEYTFTKMNFAEMIQGVVDEIQSLADEKDLRLSFHADTKNAVVSADVQKLKQVVQNLIDNAIKYTPKGFVRVGLRTEGQSYVFSVADSGLGMPHELIPHLFEEFVRDKNLKDKILGTGFGLYIARRIVEAHGGKVWAESDGQGKGSQFYVALKKAE